jgi:hypothetical protein
MIHLCEEQQFPHYQVKQSTILQKLSQEFLEKNSRGTAYRAPTQNPQRPTIVSDDLV